MFKPLCVWMFFLYACCVHAQSTNLMALNSLDPRIQKIVADISDERIAGIMRKLESFETRHTLSDALQTNRGIGAAWRWIFDEFKTYSPRLQVSFDTHQIKKTNRVYKDVELRNVVALLPGSMPESSNRWIIISG